MPCRVLDVVPVHRIADGLELESDPMFVPEAPMCGEREATRGFTPLSELAFWGRLVDWHPATNLDPWEISTN